MVYLKYRSLFLLLLIFFLSSCTAIQRSRIWKKGKLENLSEVTVVPFQERFGMIFLTVNIEGQDFNFLLDTGAPNVLDKQTLAALGKKAKRFGSVGDAYNRKSELGFTFTKSFKIGPLDFKNTGALIADFRSIPEFDCMNIDGLIGSNLMKRAVWQFDFQKKEIRIAPSLSALDVSNAYSAQFYTTGQGTPKVNLKVGSQQIRGFTVDFGSGHGITTLKDSIEPDNARKTKLQTVGTVGVGLYGAARDSIPYLLTDSLQLGANPPLKAVLRSRTNTGGLMGLRFWGNYKVTLDWNSNQIFYEPYDDQQMEAPSFGFGIETRKDTFLVSTLSMPSPASDAGLEIGDYLLELDGQPLLSDAFCSLYETLKAKEQIELKVRREERTFSVRLKKRDLFAPVYQENERE